jgi:hypothetical protein
MNVHFVQTSTFAGGKIYINVFKNKKIERFSNARFSIFNTNTKMKQVLRNEFNVND